MPTSLYLLQAATLAASALSASGTTQVMADNSYATVVSGGLYPLKALREGQSILERAQLVETRDGRLYPTNELMRIRDMPDGIAVELILRALVLVEQPLWLWGLLDEVGLHWENVPDTEQGLMKDMLRTPEEREAYLLSLARTVDTARLSELGALGEEFVVEACQGHLRDRGRADLERMVCRVSLVSDQLGYDVTATDTGGTRHRFEVKATRLAVDRVEFFLSRNEAEYAARDLHWALVAVCIDGTQDRVLGWCRSNAIAAHLPVDTSDLGRWASVRISLPLTDLEPGLPLDV